MPLPKYLPAIQQCRIHDVEADALPAEEGPPTPCLTPTGEDGAGDTCKDAQRCTSCTCSKCSSATETITSTDLFPFKLCRDLIQLNGGDDGYWTLSLLVAFSVVITVLQAVTYIAAYISLWTLDGAKYGTLTGADAKWNTATAFGACLAVVYVATKIVGQYFSWRRMSRDLSGLESVLSPNWYRFLGFVNVGQFLVMLSSVYIFSTVIAQATDLISLISNFIGLGVVSEVDELMGDFLKIEDKRAEEFNGDKKPISPTKALVQAAGVLVSSFFVYMLVFSAFSRIKSECSYFIQYNADESYNVEYDVLRGSVYDNAKHTAAYQLGAMQLNASTASVNVTNVNFSHVNLTRLNLTYHDVQRVQDIGFYFPFFNEHMKALTVDSTGAIRLDHGSISPNPALAPFFFSDLADGPDAYALGSLSGSSASSPPLLALFWTEDFDLSRGGSVYAGPVTNTSFAVVYDRIPLIGVEWATSSSVGPESVGYVTAEVLLDICGSITMTWHAETVMPEVLHTRVHIGIDSGDQLADKAGLIYTSNRYATGFSTGIPGKILTARPQNGACGSRFDDLMLVQPRDKPYTPTYGVEL